MRLLTTMNLCESRAKAPSDQTGVDRANSNEGIKRGRRNGSRESFHDKQGHDKRDEDRGRDPLGWPRRPAVEATDDADGDEPSPVPHPFRHHAKYLARRGSRRL